MNDELHADLIANPDKYLDRITQMLCLWIALDIEHGDDAVDINMSKVAKTLLPSTVVMSDDEMDLIRTAGHLVLCEYGPTSNLRSAIRHWISEGAYE